LQALRAARPKQFLMLRSNFHVADHPGTDRNYADRISVSDNGTSQPLTDVEPHFLLAVPRKADQPELASTILLANSSGRVNMTSWLPSISTKLNPPRREDILG
jgi:hypothetical protein